MCVGHGAAWTEVDVTSARGPQVFEELPMEFAQEVPHLLSSPIPCAAWCCFPSICGAVPVAFIYCVAWFQMPFC